MPITTGAITPSNQPFGSAPKEITRRPGCTGTLLSVGNAETRTIDDRHDDEQTQVRREAGPARRSPPQPADRPREP